MTAGPTTLAPIAVALDSPDRATALAWATETGPYVCAVKVGLELFVRYGREVVSSARECSGRPVFLDLKLHDIPHTVAGAAKAVADLEPWILTVHAAGGPAMIEAAAQAVPDTLIAAVTVLTSLGADDLARVGLAGPPPEAVRRLAVLAVGSGARALVCSPQEVAMLRAEVGPDILLITPGVRPLGGTADDQARTATPEQALADGADLLVVGRPITGAAVPAAAARSLAEIISRRV